LAVTRVGTAVGVLDAARVAVREGVKAGVVDCVGGAVGAGLTVGEASGVDVGEAVVKGWVDEGPSSVADWTATVGDSGG
jgi:hypothetical protein